MMERDLCIPSLPEDIIVDIASRLCAKDACRLKCLSKSWLSLISSDSQFKKLHRHQAEKWPVLVLHRDVDLPLVNDEGFGEGVPPVYDFQHKYINHEAYFVGCCRDLICFSSSYYGICVYSPSTSQYLCVSHRSDDNVGLVYIASLNIYKIVVIHKCYALLDNIMCQVEARTLHEDEDGSLVAGGNSWELIQKPTLSGSVFNNLIGVNGVIYTIVVSKTDECKVLSLDFNEDDENPQFKTFTLPHVCHHVQSTYRSFYLSQVKDVLCYPIVSKDYTAIDLWLLEDGNTSSWFKGYVINYNVPPTTLFPRDFVRNVLYFPHPTKLGASGLFFFQLGPQIYQYNICTKETQTISSEPYLMLPTHVFYDNLVPLKCISRSD